MSGFVLSIGGVMALSGNIPWVAAESVLAVNCPECAVVFLGGKLPELKRAAGLIIDGDAGALPAGSPVGIQLITCGRCGMNTVSIRGVCEPMELPVERSGRSDFACMAEFAADILLGNAE